MAVPDAYRCAVADGAYQDPEVWEHYEQGFSFAVVVKAVREARMGALPSPGSFLKLCIKHRRWFRTTHSDTNTLLNVRWEAEDAIEKIDPQRLLLDYDPDDEANISF